MDTTKGQWDAVVTDRGKFNLTAQLVNAGLVKKPEPGQLPGLERPRVGNNPNVAPAPQGYMAGFSYGDMVRQVEISPGVANPSGMPAWVRAQSAQPDAMNDVVSMEAARIPDGGVLYRGGKPSAQPLAPSPVAGRPFEQAVPKPSRNGTTGLPASPFALMPSAPVERMQPELATAMGIASMPVVAAVPEIIGSRMDARLPSANARRKGGRPSRPIN